MSLTHRSVTEPTFVRAAKPKVKGKDLTPKSPAKVKGGGWMNDNITLVRSAKPKLKAKDLTPKSPAKVKGGIVIWMNK